jgi:hypothetical protein
VTLLPHESHTYYLPDLADMPDGVWSGRFDASGNIALVVQQLSGASGMAYTGFGEGTGNISVPLTFKRSAGWDAGIQVQNVGNTETAVAVVHYSAAGGTTEERATIPVGRSKTFYLPGNADLADGHMGAALINSSNGQPIVAIVNLVNPQRAGDAAMVYEGINY